MPQAATRIKTSSDVGAGVGRSAISRCLYLERRRAFMPVGHTFHQRIERTSGYSTVTHMRRFLKQGEFVIPDPCERRLLVGWADSPAGSLRFRGGLAAG